jgi:hypothetical protein
MTKLFKIEGYNPNALFDELIDRYHLRTDSALAKKLGVGAPVICKARNKTASITGELLLRMWDVTGIPVDMLRSIAGIPMFGKEPEPIEHKEDEDQYV